MSAFVSFFPSNFCYRIVYVTYLGISSNEASEHRDTVKEKKKRLMEFLSDIGIEKDAIESRYYSEMLKELPNG
jgi:adenylate cyclase class IV